MTESLRRACAARPLSAHELGIMQGFPPPPEKRPTLSNWDLAPFNRWSFQNVRSLIPTVEVRCGNGAATGFDYDLQEFDALRLDSETAGATTLGDFLLDSYTDGLLVMHRGRVVVERYLNGMTPETLHLSQSVAKSVVSTLAGALVGRGVLDPAAEITKLVPELAACGYAGARVQHVLDMTSGVRFSEDYDTPGSDMTRIDIASAWRPVPPGETRSTIRDVILTLPRIRPHGAIFEYRSIETDVLAWVIERAAGRPLAELLSQEIWQPIGAERDACFTVDAAGTALADGGFNATLRDYARFGRLLLDGGRVGDLQLLPADWVAACRRGRRELFGAPYDEVSPNGAYSNNWWVHDVDRGDIMARGVFGQKIYVDPEADFLVVKLSSWPDFLMPARTRDTLRAFAAIREALLAR